MAKSQWCEECKDYKSSAYRRPAAGGRVLCNQHHYEALRRNSPTGLVPRLTRMPDYLQEEADV